MSISSIGLEALSDGTSNTVGVTEQSHLVKDASGEPQDWGASGHRDGGWNSNYSNSNWVSNITHIYWTINSVCPGIVTDAHPIVPTRLSYHLIPAVRNLP